MRTDSSQNETKGKRKVTYPAKDPETLLHGEFWREQALHALILYWDRYARDKEHGAFYLNMSRDWRPCPPWDKAPAMISRNVFGFCAAYLLSGEEKYLEVAREGVDYLLEHAWDREYGGWFDRLTQMGEPKITTKSIALQLYTNLGLTLYHFTTGETQALSYVEESLAIQQTRGHDKEFGGYFQALNRDLSVKEDGKNKHAHYGYVSSLLLRLWLVTRSPRVLLWERQLMDLTLERMLDPLTRWVYGYNGNFLDRQWNRLPEKAGEKEVVHIGSQLNAALSLLLLYQQTGETLYLEQGKELGERINRYGWDSESGAWLDLIEKRPPCRPALPAAVSYWVQIYGGFLQLQLYRLSREERYLERFKKSETFCDRYFMDRQYGGVFTGLSFPEGIPSGGGRKAGAFRAAYHEMEHALLNYLYLNLYVNRQPAVLHFRLKGAESAKKHFVCLVDDPSVRISGVQIDGRPWAKFDPQERSVLLPVISQADSPRDPGQSFKVEVTLAPEGV